MEVNDATAYFGKKKKKGVSFSLVKNTNLAWTLRSNYTSSAFKKSLLIVLFFLANN